jgi:hypothetical protein
MRLFPHPNRCVLGPHGEQMTGRAFVRQTVELRWTGFPGILGSIELAMPPAREVLSIQYSTTTPSVQRRSTLDPAAYIARAGA